MQADPPARSLAPPGPDVRVALPLLSRSHTTWADSPCLPPTAPAYIRDARRLIDAHGRTIRDLRISVTDRCNFRCVYCMEPDVKFARREDLLTPDEIVRISRIAESLGIRKVRLTGGEPTLHPELTRIIGGIRSEAGVELALITNGSRLTRASLREWRIAGLARVTISIDTLRPERFAAITRSNGRVDDVLAGADACLTEGLAPLKLNAVLVRHVNDDEAADLASLAPQLGVAMRFIEYMPLDSGRAWDVRKWVSAAETKSAIERRFRLVSADDDDPASTSRTFRFAHLPTDSPARVGFIAPVSNPFCGACSRLRVTADGKVRPCLFSTTEWDMRTLLRNGAADRFIADFLIDAVWSKQSGHNIATPAFARPMRPMSAIGG